MINNFSGDPAFLPDGESQPESARERFYRLRGAPITSDTVTEPLELSANDLVEPLKFFFVGWRERFVRGGDMVSSTDDMNLPDGAVFTIRPAEFGTGEEYRIGMMLERLFDVIRPRPEFAAIFAGHELAKSRRIFLNYLESIADQHGQTLAQVAEDFGLQYLANWDNHDS